MWHIQFRILPVSLLLDRCWSVSPLCLLMCHFPESCSSCWHPWKSSDSKMTHFFLMWSLSSWDWAVYALNWLLNCGDVVTQESLSGLAVCSVVWIEWITEAESMGLPCVCQVWEVSHTLREALILKPNSVAISWRLRLHWDTVMCSANVMSIPSTGVLNRGWRR